MNRCWHTDRVCKINDFKLHHKFYNEYILHTLLCDFAAVVEEVDGRDS